MSSISLSLKMLLAGSALAGLTLLACGEDSDGDKSSNTDETSTGNKADGGKKDAATPRKDAGAQIPMGEEGEECTGLGAVCSECDDAPRCFTQCIDGVYGECKSAASLLGDAGLPTSIRTDAGNFTIKDGSVTVKINDAEVELPATECPDPFVCGDLGGLSPVKYCSEGLFPPACATTQDCTDKGFKLATCGKDPILGMMGCIQICK